jgi:hypothetical protein
LQHTFVLQPGAAAATENSLSKKCKAFMAPAATKYDDVAAVNKVAAVQAQVSQLSISVYVRVVFFVHTHTHTHSLLVHIIFRCCCSVDY